MNNRTLVKTETFVKKNPEDHLFKFTKKPETRLASSVYHTPRTPRKSTTTVTTLGDNSQIIEGDGFKIKRRMDLATSTIISNNNTPVKDKMVTSMVLDSNQASTILTKPVLKPQLKFKNSQVVNEKQVVHKYQEM
jgi:hypothetical protein